MPKTDPRVDAIIEKSADFAKPLLRHLRTLVHDTLPHVEEAIKWGMPHFMSHGSILCMMAPFKAHVAFGFHKAPLMKDAEKLKAREDEGMGHLGRLATLEDLPSDRTLVKWLKEADAINAKGLKCAPARRGTRAAPVKVPADLKNALKTNPQAQQVFDAFPPSHKREYITWLTDAKTEATRSKRLAQALQMIAEGKQRHWKYVK